MKFNFCIITLNKGYIMWRTPTQGNGEPLEPGSSAKFTSTHVDVTRQWPVIICGYKIWIGSSVYDIISLFMKSFHFYIFTHVFNMYIARLLSDY